MECFTQYLYPVLLKTLLQQLFSWKTLWEQYQSPYKNVTSNLCMGLKASTSCLFTEGIFCQLKIFMMRLIEIKELSPQISANLMHIRISCGVWIYTHNFFHLFWAFLTSNTAVKLVNLQTLGGVVCVVFMHTVVELSTMPPVVSSPR